MTDIIQVLQSALENLKANLHTSTIGRVVKVNAKTIDVQPVINREVDGQNIRLPIFVNVPPVWLHGGSSYTAHPIAVGDYALLIFNERCFDNWYAGRDEVLPLEPRMHDYSDAVAIVGLYNRAGEITIPTRITQIGDTFQQGDYEHQGNREQTGDYILTGDFTINGQTVKNGNLTINGSVTINGGSGGGTVNASNCTINLSGGDVIADGISLKTHTHGGVQVGGGNTGQPN